MAKILLVEDDESMRDSIIQALSNENYQVESVGNGIDGLERLQTYGYDLAIVDWGLPGLSGLELCKQYKGSEGRCLILMLTGKASQLEKETGFQAGVDDYLTKPFSLRELLARVRSLLRRAGQAPSNSVLRAHDIEVDVSALRVAKAGTPLQLSKKELALLILFMRNAGQVFGAEALLQGAWPEHRGATTETVRTHLKTLRRKIDSLDQPSLIETVHGVGYRFKP